MIKISILVDNSSYIPSVGCEHGFACWIEIDEHRVLFDTGASNLIRQNATYLGINLEDINAIIISHGHYDHTGGLPYIWGSSRIVPLYLHPFALTNRYRISQNIVKDIGIPLHVKELINNNISWIRYVQKPVQLLPHLWLTGPIPRVHPQEAHLDKFFLDTSAQQLDLIPDDQAIYILSAKGLIVLLGCAHAGVINTIVYIRELTRSLPLLAIIGGMHLQEMPATHIEWTAAQLKKFQPSLIIPTHCTGAKASSILKDHFKEAWHPGGVGACFEFES